MRKVIAIFLTCLIVFFAAQLFMSYLSEKQLEKIKVAYEVIDEYQTYCLALTLKTGVKIPECSVIEPTTEIDLFKLNEDIFMKKNYSTNFLKLAWQNPETRFFVVVVFAFVAVYVIYRVIYFLLNPFKRG